MSNQTRTNVNYGLNQPLNLEIPQPIVAKRAPTTADKAPIGQEWVNTVTNSVYFLTSIANNLANWTTAGGGAGVFSSLVVNPGPTSLSTVGNGAVSIGNATNTGAITITVGTGNFAIVGAAHTIGIGNDAAANTVILGSTTGAASTTIQGGTAGVAVNTSATGTISLGLATMTGIITIGQSTAVAGQAINIGITAAPNVITIGSKTGAAGTTIQAGTSQLTLDATGQVAVVPVDSLAIASPTATAVINAKVGYANFTGFTTAAAASQVFTITCNQAASGSAIFVTANNGGANDAQMTVTRVLMGVGTFDVTLKNNGAQALNGDVNITFWIIAT